MAHAPELIEVMVRVSVNVRLESGFGSRFRLVFGLGLEVGSGTSAHAPRPGV